MKVVTYNLNGIRSAMQKGFLAWLEATQADVVCLQEVKATPDQIPLPLIEALGYQCFFNPAQKKGYSGTAIFTKIPPLQWHKGYAQAPQNIDTDDTEGRLLRIDFAQLSILCVYMPSGASGRERQDYKMHWLAHFYQYIQALQRQLPALLIVGDYNIAHQPIDIHNPKANAKSSGFLPEERQWLTDFLDLGFIDTFRTLNPEPHNYSWWSIRNPTIRARNLGWRIDYQLLSTALKPALQRAILLPEARHSDHCPVMTELLLV